MQDSVKCDSCGEEIHIGDYPYCPHGRMHLGPTPGGYPDEKVVVYQSAQEGGKIQYPGRNNEAMPDRLRARGYERVEIAPRDLGRFEKRNGVVNERRHFDRNGKTD